MKRKNPNLFCFFSGYAHQDAELLEYQNNIELGTVKFICKNNGKERLSSGDYIQLNGVIFEIISIEHPNFIACTTIELLKNTALHKTKPGTKLTLGILAEKDLVHQQLWTLQPSTSGQASYKGYSILSGHDNMLKLDFETSINLASIIKNDTHLGLSGSSLTAREVIIANDLITFSVYCGRETREHSAFNQNLTVGTVVDITEGAAIVEEELIELKF